MDHRIELAKSGRAKCRACKRSIAKGEPRFAESVPNPVADGDTRHFYHPTCAAERRPGPLGELLASDVQGDLAELLDNLGALTASVALAQRHHRLERLGAIERAKSGRAKCRQCRVTIERGALRVALQPIEDGMVQNWGFLHLGCIASYAGVQPSAARLTRYSDLCHEDATEALTLVESGALDEAAEAPPPADGS